MDIDFEYSNPLELAQEATLEDLWTAATGIEQWAERPAEVLDFIYQFRLIGLLRGRAGIEELLELAEHLDRYGHPAHVALKNAVNGLKKPYASRWLTYKDLLDRRMSAIDNRSDKDLLGRVHVREMLELLARGGEMNHGDLQRALNLRAANTTRIVNMLEANELVECQRQGREKHASITDLGRALLGSGEQTREVPSSHRAFSFGALRAGRYDPNISARADRQAA